VEKGKLRVHDRVNDNLLLRSMYCTGWRGKSLLLVNPIEYHLSWVLRGRGVVANTLCKSLYWTLDTRLAEDPIEEP